MDKLKLIKTIVFTLTFLLIFGSLIMLTSLYKKTRYTPEPIPSEINLSEPSGSSIKKIYNIENNLYIVIEGGGESDRIIIFDSQAGKKISKINLN